MNTEHLDEKEGLVAFFRALNELCLWYVKWTGKSPTILRINPQILQELANIEGFYSREEIGSEVTAHAPMVRTFKLITGLVTIQEDWALAFLALDDESVF